jgi:catechol 2,3-dioxygenase-like lactoylglutathione lyase family enzyme
MLANNRIISFLGVDDLDAARDFYTNTLGLTKLSEDDYTLVFDAGGRALRISRVQDFLPQDFSVLGWEVEDIAVRVKALMEVGVIFNNYEELMGI